MGTRGHLTGLQSMELGFLDSYLDGIREALRRIEAGVEGEGHGVMIHDPRLYFSRIRR